MFILYLKYVHVVSSFFFIFGQSARENGLTWKKVGGNVPNSSHPYEVGVRKYCCTWFFGTFSCLHGSQFFCWWWSRVCKGDQPQKIQPQLFNLSSIDTGSQRWVCQNDSLSAVVHCVHVPIYPWEILQIELSYCTAEGNANRTLCGWRPNVSYEQYWWSPRRTNM